MPNYDESLTFDVWTEYTDCSGPNCTNHYPSTRTFPREAVGDSNLPANRRFQLPLPDEWITRSTGHYWSVDGHAVFCSDDCELKWLILKISRPLEWPKQESDIHERS